MYIKKLELVMNYKDYCSICGEYGIMEYAAGDGNYNCEDCMDLEDEVTQGELAETRQYENYHRG
jgi:hypothetical protein